MNMCASVCVWSSCWVLLKKKTLQFPHHRNELKGRRQTRNNMHYLSGVSTQQGGEPVWYSLTAWCFHSQTCNRQKTHQFLLEGGQSKSWNIPSCSVFISSSQWLKFSAVLILNTVFWWAVWMHIHKKKTKRPVSLILQLLLATLWHIVQFKCDCHLLASEQIFKKKYWKKASVSFIWKYLRRFYSAVWNKFLKGGFWLYQWTLTTFWHFTPETVVINITSCWTLSVCRSLHQDGGRP